MIKKLFGKLMAEIKKEAFQNIKFKRFALIFVGIIGLLIVSYASYTIIYLNKTLPSVMIGRDNFSHLTYDEAKSKLALLSANAVSQPVTISYQGNTYQIDAKEIDLTYDNDATAKHLLSIGREGGIWSSFANRIRCLFQDQSVEAVVNYDPAKFDKRFGEIITLVSQSPKNASASIVDGVLNIEAEKSGKVTDENMVKGQILGCWMRFGERTLTVEQEAKTPEIIIGNEEDLRAVVDKLINIKAELTYSGGKKSLTKSEVGQLIDFKGESAGDLSAQKVLTAQYSMDKSIAFVKQMATTLDQKSQNAKLEIKDSQLSVATPSKKGLTVDVEASSQKLYTSLVAMSGAVAVELTQKVEEPTVSESSLANLGIKERVGFGETSFAGSTTNRKINITNGVSLIQSAVVAPGTEFSTVETLGNIDDTTGFVPELVIKENKTVPEFGGGLCQVATTLFRSVLNAGLKVTERQNHSYRVGYYEPPVGLDATIYGPHPDFRFVNDTANYLLIQGRIEKNKVIFELWGTGDGRVATLEGPTVSDYVEPPAPVYTETNTLPKGETKQADKPHQGATAIAYYTVKKGDTIITKKTFKSVYKATPAKYLVGTADPVPAATPVP